MNMPAPALSEDEDYYRDLAEGAEASARGREKIAGAPEHRGEHPYERARRKSCAQAAQQFWRQAAKLRRCLYAAQVFNLMLRIKVWVLSCPKRRARVRALIGEAAIARWQVRLMARLMARLQMLAEGRVPKRSAALELVSGKLVSGKLGFGKPSATLEDTDGLRSSRYNPSRYSPWYGLWPMVPFGPQARQHGSTENTGESTGESTGGRGERGGVMRACMARAVPRIFFYPYELEPAYTNLANTRQLCWLDEAPPEQVLQAFGGGHGAEIRKCGIGASAYWLCIPDTSPDISPGTSPATLYDNLDEIDDAKPP